MSACPCVSCGSQEMLAVDLHGTSILPLTQFLAETLSLSCVAMAHLLSVFSVFSAMPTASILQGGSMGAVDPSLIWDSPGLVLLHSDTGHWLSVKTTGGGRLF